LLEGKNLDKGLVAHETSAAASGSRGGIAVVFGFGEILEVWDAAKRHEHVRAVAKTKRSAISEAIEDLGQR
jgi:hypothetical protein